MQENLNYQIPAQNLLEKKQDLDNKNKKQNSEKYQKANHAKSSSFNSLKNAAAL